MFFVRKENIGTVLGAQKEFAAAERRGIDFFTDAVAGHADQRVWHYLWPADKLEPSIRESLVLPPAADAVVGEEDAQRTEPPFFIWSQHVARGDMIGEPLISVFRPEAGNPDWRAVARERWVAAHGAQVGTGG